MKAQQVLDGLDVVFRCSMELTEKMGLFKGLLELADVPYVGIRYNRIRRWPWIKQWPRLYWLPEVSLNCRILVVLRSQWEQNPELVRREIEDRIGYPCFVKPANLGSSVGISKVRGPEELDGALAEAATYDRKLVIEQDAGNVREVECSVFRKRESSCVYTRRNCALKRIL